MVGLKFCLPKWSEVLDLGLGVELAGQVVEQGGLGPLQVGEPVLMCQCHVILVGLVQNRDHLCVQIAIIQFALPHLLQPEEDHPHVKSLEPPWQAQDSVRVGGDVASLFQHGTVVGGEV